MRADKLCLAGLAATLRHYIKGEACREIPVWQMITLSNESIRLRAEQWINELGVGVVLPTHSAIGGGSLPGEMIPTHVLALNLPSPNQFIKKLRQQAIPIIARIENDKVVFDPRTIPESQNAVFLNQLKKLLNN